MIRFKINTNMFNSEVRKVTSEIQDIKNAQNIANMSRAVGSIAAKEFVKSLNRQAEIQKGKYHHLYEWNEIGDDKSRLFKVKRVASGNKSSVEISLKKSRKNVPVAEALLQPGKTEKSVVRRSIYANKAEVMERGRPTKSWKAKRNIVFLGNSSLIFKRTGYVMPGVKNPGGISTKNALKDYAKQWESGMASGAIERSNIFIEIEKVVAAELSKTRTSSTQIRAAIKSVCSKYDIGYKEF